MNLARSVRLILDLLLAAGRLLSGCNVFQGSGPSKGRRVHLRRLAAHGQPGLRRRRCGGRRQAARLGGQPVGPGAAGYRVVSPRGQRRRRQRHRHLGGHRDRRRREEGRQGHRRGRQLQLRPDQGLAGGLPGAGRAGGDGHALVLQSPAQGRLLFPGLRHRRRAGSGGRPLPGAAARAPSPSPSSTPRTTMPPACATRSTASLAAWGSSRWRSSSSKRAPPRFATSCCAQGRTPTPSSWPATFPDGETLLLDLQAMAWRPSHVMLSDANFVFEVPDTAGKAGEGVYVSTISPDPRAVTGADWAKDYRLVVKHDPGMDAVTGYQAADVLIRGFEKANGGLRRPVHRQRHPRAGLYVAGGPHQVRRQRQPGGAEGLHLPDQERGFRAGLAGEVGRAASARGTRGKVRFRGRAPGSPPSAHQGSRHRRGQTQSPAISFKGE